MASDPVPLFAYGSNLTIAYVHQSCPSAQTVMRASLPNFGIGFPHYATRFAGGVCSIVERPGALVEGVIYRIARAELEALDRQIFVPEGLYRRETFRVLGEDAAWHQAELHRVTRQAGPFPPADAYLDLMIGGAEAHGLSADYIAALKALRQPAR